MATLAQKSTLANDSTFQSLVRAAMLKAALDIVGESSSTTNTDKRQALGVKILTGGFNILVWANAVVMQADIATADDTAITTAVSGIWNDMAGITSV